MDFYSKGPTCLLIRCDDLDQTVIGAFTEERWRDNNRFYGIGVILKTFIYKLSIDNFTKMHCISFLLRIAK